MEANAEKAVRPNGFDEYLGQPEAKRNLKVFVAAAKARGEFLDHILLSGPPGLGKTSLASVVANEMGSKLVTVHAPSLRKKGDLVSILLDLEEGDILFIDEIHSLTLAVEEILYPVMEDFTLRVVTGDGQAVDIPLPRFTLMAATTRAGDLTAPLRDRFGEVIQMQFYSEAELAQVVLQASRKLGLNCTHDGAREIAKRSKGTPRVANRLLRRARDFAQVMGSAMTGDAVREACEALGVDEAGLDRTTRAYVKYLSTASRPVGLNTISSFLGESPSTLEESIEPYLIRTGLLEKMPQGRMLTARGRSHAVSMP